VIETARLTDSNGYIYLFADINPPHALPTRVDPMKAQPAYRYQRWEDLPLEPMKGTITRRLISGKRLMIAQVFLKKGDVVPQHSHDNEQLTYILSGALSFRLGDASDGDVIVRAGEVLIIPPNLPHSAVALEDTLDIDVFSPPREDWLTGTDDYLRNDT
jgi:quercetin dioxygenase-like cupin family protein